MKRAKEAATLSELADYVDEFEERALGTCEILMGIVKALAEKVSALEAQQKGGGQ